MRFSVVIPAHNGLALVRDAAHTVLDQLPPNGELVLFDNASDENFHDYVASLNDGRVKLIRSERFLPVTESWNTAFDAATGDYVFFLGSDDGLAPGCFERVGAIVEQFNRPEAIYGALYQFFHPGVAPWHAEGCVREVRYGFFFRDTTEAFLVSRADVRRAVLGSLQLKRNFNFTSQSFVLRQDFLKRLRGPKGVFQSPFPDYYLSNVILAKSKSTVICPKPFSIQGVAKGSFGYTLFNNLEAQGDQYLNTDLQHDPLYQKVAGRILPGPTYGTKYAITMEYVARDTAAEIGVPFAWRRYRRLLIHAHGQRLGGRRLFASEEGRAVWNRLDSGEKTFALCLRAAARLSRITRQTNRFFQTVTGRWASHCGVPASERVMNCGGFQSMSECYDALRDGRLA